MYVSIVSGKSFSPADNRDEPPLSGKSDHSFNSRPQKEEVRPPEEILNEKRTRDQSGQQNQTNVH